ncbi:hypothetical protein CLOP_g17646, partial [Closterium sp. NIES-67]
MAAPLPPALVAAVAHGSAGSTGRGVVGENLRQSSIAAGDVGQGGTREGGAGEGRAGEGSMGLDVAASAAAAEAGVGGAGTAGEAEKEAAGAPLSLSSRPSLSAVQYLLETLSAMPEDVVTQQATLFLLLLYSHAFKDVFSGLLIQQYPHLVLNVLHDHNPSARFLKIEKALDRGLLIWQYPHLVLNVLHDHNPSARFLKIKKALDR